MEIGYAARFLFCGISVYLTEKMNTLTRRKSNSKASKATYAQTKGYSSKSR